MASLETQLSSEVHGEPSEQDANPTSFDMERAEPALGVPAAKTVEPGLAAEGEEKRQAWSNRTEFILMTVGYAVGLGNVWRFPYLCYQNGGGAFMVPYLISLVFLGMPLMLLELSIGQILRKGPFHSLRAVDPRLAGVGWAALICACTVGIYYNMVIAWALFYFFASFASPVPWTADESTGMNSTVFWEGNALGLSSAADDPQRWVPGGMNLHMVGMLFLVCLMCWMAVLRGVETSGKAVYVTSTMPYVFLTILVVRGVTLEGASDGIQFYLFGEVDEAGVHRLSMEKLMGIEVWQKAATQIFYSLGIGFGSLIAFGSYNPRDEDIVLDAVLIPLINSGTSVFAGFAIFSLLGHMAHEQGTTVSEVAGDGGTGLAFIVYPDGLSHLPAATPISICFFLMLFFLGFGSQFPTLEVPITMLKDSGVDVPQEKMTGLICLALFIPGLIMATDAGKYWVDLFDEYTCLFCLHVIAVFEVVAMSWVYGAERVADDIKKMTGRGPPRFVVFLWKWAIPPILVGLLLTTFKTKLAADLGAVGDGSMPGWIFAISWMLALWGPITILWFLLRPCSQYPAAITPPPPADGPVVPVPNHYTSLSWLSCFVCLPLGIFAVDESQRSQALSKEERHAEAAQAARWSAKLAYIALGMAAIFYPLFLWGGAAPAADATAQTCAPPVGVSNHYDLSSVAVKFTGTHYDEEPTGAPLMVEVSGVACTAASRSVSPVVNVCVMHNVPGVPH